MTVIASESYDSFAKGLQSEIAEAVADRPRAITVDLFVGKVIKDSSGHEQVIDKDIADAIMYDLIINRYIDKKGALTDKYYEEKANGTLQVAEEVADCAASVVEIIGSIYDPKTMQPENARSNNVELHVDEEKIAMPEFKALWSKINAKSVYIVDFDTDELVQKAIASLDAKLRVAKIFFKVESGVMEEIKSKEALESGAAFIKETSASYGTQTRISVNSSVKYDLVGKLVEETKLTRKDIIAILRGIQKPVFEQFKDNPEEFIIKAAALINDEKATAIIQHITYDVLDERYGTEVFTDQELRVGDADDGISIDGKARDLLKAVYLKPLRDAEREMSSGRSSRISQILLNHPVFKDKNEHTVLGIFQDANQKIEEYFTNDPEGKSILQTIRDNLEAFNDKGQKSDAELKTSDIQIKAILESLSLKAPELNPGLGELNLLFIAAELLLLKDDTDGGLKLALIEELEAHLHPQAQLRLISYLQNEYNENDVQIIVSTHSPILASKINLKNLILMKDGKGFDLAEGATGLQKGDYLFLQRFLDSTKANLFFAKGIIMVEGDAENILIPVIADIIGYPLEKYGVSIVNVGSTAFLRYSGILIRKNGEKIGIPVSVITDCDVRPYDIDEKTKEKQFNEKVSESLQAEQAKNEKYSNGSVRGFTSPRWTLEYCIAMSCLSEDFHKAVHYGKKILNAQENIAITDSKIDEANGLVKEEAKQWDSLPLSKRAYNIFSLMLNADGKSGLKAIVAQCLASILRWKVSVIPEKLTQEKMFDVELYGLKTDEKKKVELSNKIENDSFLGYIVRAIKYASGIEE